MKLVQKRFDMIGEKARCFLQCKATLMGPSRQAAFFGPTVANGGIADMAVNSSDLNSYQSP